jgi:Xylanase inhibitor N-terminal
VANIVSVNKVQLSGDKSGEIYRTIPCHMMNTFAAASIALLLGLGLTHDGMGSIIVEDIVVGRGTLSVDLFREEGIALDKRRLRRLMEETAFTRSSRGLSKATNVTEMTPLYQGLGTHFSYIYVGTPPQRVSVIVDTGSHHTAFPCVGCQCGKHMDPYFDPKKSNTSEIQTCSGKKRCYFSQAYR